MSSSQLVSQSQYVIEGINERSSVSEMISVLRHSFQEKEFDEVERLLIIREKEQRTKLKNLKKDFDTLRGEYDSLERNYGRTSLDKIKLEQELVDCKSQLNKLKVTFDKIKPEQELVDCKSHLNKLKVTCEELCRGASSADARYKCLAKELKRVKLERESNLAKMIEELAKKDKELKKVKEEKETELGEMTEKLAKKDAEINQLRTERENILEKVTHKVLFLEEDIMKELAVDAISPEKTSPAEAVTPSTNVPSGKHPLSAPEIIEIDDSEDEVPMARGGSTHRAKRGRSTSDSDDSSCFGFAGGEVQDTDQSKKGRTWFDSMIEKEKQMNQTR